MYKIEFQYLNSDGKWVKGKHKLYETKKAFDQYWKFHVKSESDFAIWNSGRKRLVAFEDGNQILIHTI